MSLSIAPDAWTVFGLIGLALIPTVLITRWTVWGGEPTGEGRTQSVRPGGDESPETLTGYHYRVSSRFGEYVKVRVADGQVSVSGARLGTGLYSFFISVQTFLWVLSALGLVAAVLGGGWWWAGAAVLLFALGQTFSAVCAGMLWETSAAGAMQEPGGFAKVVFPLAATRDVRVGKGWSRGGIGAVIWPVIKGIDSLAKDHAVSFEAPDPVTGRYVVYAIHMYDKSDAEKLAGIVGG